MEEEEEEAVNILDDGGEDDARAQLESNMKKTELRLHYMLDPAYKDKPKSLWNGLFMPCVQQLKDIEFYKAMCATEEDAYLAWYNQVLNGHRAYLQMVFEEPVALPDLSKRVATFVDARRHIKIQWREKWIEEYLKYQQLVEAEETKVAEEAKRAAIEKRRRRLEKMRQQEQPPDEEALPTDAI